MRLAGRLAYHDLLSNPQGYLPYSSLQVFSFAASQRAEGLTLEEFALVEACSLVPQNDFFSPWSWRIYLGWAAGANQGQLQAAAQAGAAWELGDTGLAYALAGSVVEARGLGANLRSGAIWWLGDVWGLHAWGEVLPQQPNESQAALESRWVLARNWELGWGTTF